jgi:hypothetical protein
MTRGGETTSPNTRVFIKSKRKSYVSLLSNLLKLKQPEKDLSVEVISTTEINNNLRLLVRKVASAFIYQFDMNFLIKIFCV